MTNQKDLQDFKGSERDEWESVRLGDVAEIILGQSPKSEFYNEEGNGPHFLQGAKNFGNRYPKLERYCSEPKREAKKGDVLISVRAPPGPVNIAPENVCIGRGVTAIRANKGPNKYLYYYLKFYKPRWESVAGGTTFKSINKSDLQSLEIPYPPLATRKRISNFLSIFDEKIETNQRLSIKLHNLAASIYKDMFVDFSPYSETVAANGDEIPASFEMGTLGDILSLEYGEGLSADKREGDKYPVYGSNGTTGRHNEFLVEGPGVIVGRKGVNFGSVKFSQENFWPIDTSFYVSGKSFDHPTYFYHLLNNMNFQHLGSDSAVPGLNRNVAHDQPVPIPPESEVSKFASRVAPMHKQRNHIENENRKLKQLRDSLNRAIMTREIHLPE